MPDPKPAPKGTPIAPAKPTGDAATIKELRDPRCTSPASPFNLPPPTHDLPARP